MFDLLLFTGKRAIRHQAIAVMMSLQGTGPLLSLALECNSIDERPTLSFCRKTHFSNISKSLGP